MTYSPFLILHICGGILGFLSGSAALVVRKGSRLHRLTGDVFVGSMLSMALSGGFLALIKFQQVNVLAGVFTFYLVASAWLTVARKRQWTGLAEIGLLLTALGIGFGCLLLLWGVPSGSARPGGGASAAFVIFGSAAFLSASGDLRMLLRGGISGAQRLVRHLWRMCVGLLIAAGSFFLGRASDPVLRQTGLRARLFPESIRQTGLPAVPVLLILILTVFWLLRVRFSKAYRSSPSPTLGQ
jgi:uncharacterized membrane protein